MYKKIIILMDDDAEPAERFLDDLLGYSTLEKIGYTVIVYCLNMRREIKRFSKNYNIQFLKSNKELEVNLKKHNPQDTLIMLILIFDFFSYRTYRVVSKSGLAYCAYLLNGWTAELEHSGFRTLRYKLSIRSILETLQTVKKPSQIKRLWWDVFPHLPNYLTRIKAPKYVLCAGVHSLNYLFWFPVDSKTKIIWGHYYDYEKYISLNNLTETGIGEAETIVFIDQKLAEDPVINQNLKIDKSKYYASLEDFFVFLENKYDFEVVVAAHPLASDEYYKDCFGDRKIVFGETDKAVMYSKAVILHASNSRTFAILFKKPIIFILNNESSRHSDFYTDTIWSATMLGKNVINIDSREELTAFDLEKELAIDAEKYEEYKEKYIKTKHSENKSVWNIFHEEISKGD